MAAASRGADAPVIEQLQRSAHRFEFFQAVRLLEAYAREKQGVELHDAGAPRAETHDLHDALPSAASHAALASSSSLSSAVGQGGPPRREPARFRGYPSLTFPGCSVRSVQMPTALRRDARAAAADESASSNESVTEESAGPIEVVVTFFGLYGPQGVLPRHYTQLIVDRHRKKDGTLRNFLDLFNHRATSFFYRAWEKYRFPYGFERARREGPSDDPFTHVVRCLVGMGTHGLRDRLELHDDVFLYYAAHFAHHPRNATTLASLLNDSLGLPASVTQFCGQWLQLDEASQSSMPSDREPDGLNMCLGVDVVVGEQVWSVENKFRVRLGPVGYAEFCEFTPLGSRLKPLAQLIRTYVGPEFDFDVQLVLRRDAVPPCRAGGDAPELPDDVCGADVDGGGSCTNGPRDEVSGDSTSGSGSFLGWNTWLFCEPLSQDADDAVFEVDGAP
ncbi:MAG TPA: type VI secretion system baseplate subunit TssG, partial [Pirellulaceae bacterium]|nr:type VI secretion system baseplate subunit TssG [Pirellulaceae bacterium]